MPVMNLSHGMQYTRFYVRDLLLDLRQQLFYPLPSRTAHPLVRAETTKNGHTHAFCTSSGHVLRHVHKRPNNAVRSIIGKEIGTHPFYGRVEKEVEEERLDKVIEMVSQCNLVPSFRGSV